MNDSRRRICYVHIGTHKTGTSSIQRGLMANADALRAMDVFVPRIGFDRDFLLGGHVNIARELTGDILFNPKFGTLADITRSIVESGAPAAILSSELFESLHRDPQRLRTLAGAIENVGYQVKIIVYLRPRARYIQSLYLQKLRHGFDCPFEEYLWYVLRNGRYDNVDKSLTFNFQYATILDAFASVFGRENIIVKAYGNKFGKAFLDEFFDTVGVPKNGARGEFRYIEENESLSFAEGLDLLFKNARLYANASGPQPLDLVRSLFDNDIEFVHRPFDVLNHADSAAIAARFASDNAEIHRVYGLYVPLSQPIPDALGAKHRRRILDAAAAAWNLTNYRYRCNVREASGMLPANVVEAAAMECPS